MKLKKILGSAVLISSMFLSATVSATGIKDIPRVAVMNFGN